MMSHTAVQAAHLTKSYRVYESAWQRALGLIHGRARHSEFSALSDVTFEIRSGEGFGLIGENGAGKSTLLKILAGITSPTSGSALVQGKVASILELGSAFHPELTGRQNIVLNAAMLGLNDRQVRAKTPEIVAFSELGEFIDRPVKTYSTGMSMRLGFAIATQVEPEVLIIDEALSVGDGYFQKKCIDRLVEYTAAGGTLLLCSHAMYYVSAFCKRALWLRNGRVAALGDAQDVVRQYEDYLVAKSGGDAELEGAAVGPARLTRAEVVGGANLGPGDTLVLEVAWETEDPALDLHLGIGINRNDGIEVCSFSTLHDGQPACRGERTGVLRLELPELPLVKGRFTVYFFLLDGHGLHIYDRRIMPDAFAVDSPQYSIGLVRLQHRWIRDGLPTGERRTEILQHV